MVTSSKPKAHLEEIMLIIYIGLAPFDHLHDDYGAWLVDFDDY